MTMKYKYLLALAPLFLTACADKIDTPNTPIAYEGDDVVFSIQNASNSRTTYAEPWAEQGNQDIYWGNYVQTDKEYINIYCPENPERGFARYEVNHGTDQTVAESIVKTSEIGVQWGAKGQDYHFYAFYPADKASETMNGTTIRATVIAEQNPHYYKYKDVDGNTITDLTSISDYNSKQYKDGAVINFTPKTIYAMPTMDAAVMVARRTMTPDDYGKEVPLRFNVLADVLDITLNGPITPNTLGANANPTTGFEGTAASFIQIQNVTIQVVTPNIDANGNQTDDISLFAVNHDKPISGSFDLNMSESAINTADMIQNVTGSAAVQLQTSMSEKDKVYYPTLFVRKSLSSGTVPTASDIDHMRLRAFLIPGQINKDNLNTLRLHLQTNCGDFYQMLENDGNFATGQIYPVKLGYFRTRGEDFDLSKWVSQLDPDIYLSELSVPGAWHAANPNAQGNVTIQQLYDAGIRAFEVHTANGTVPFIDKDFKTELTTRNVNSADVSWHEEQRINEKTETANPSVDASAGGTVTGDRYSTSASGTGLTVTQTQTVTYNQYPEFYLRLYRTSNITEAKPNPDDSYSDALIAAANNMKPSGFMFLEFGFDWGDSGRPVTVPWRTVTETRRRSKSGLTLSGTKSWLSSNPSVSDVTWTIPDGTFTDADEWGEPEYSYSYSTTTIDHWTAWPIAVESCLNRLRSKPNESTGRSQILYTDEITSSTTIRNIHGYLIAKINTNFQGSPNVDGVGQNENLLSINGIGWSGSTPALFSRWVNDSESKPQTVNMKWGMPVAPFSTPETSLRWCFTEQDNISSITTRKAAIDLVNEEIAKNYSSPLHNTYYEISIGGYDNGSPKVASGYQSVASQLNSYVLSKISDPSRTPVPVGFVFMNYAIPPKGQEDTYQSAQLIRAIINNNKALLLRRADSSTPSPVSARDKTNSHFTNNTKNPLK